jgi:metal-dependent amidase/aminoacylase/carboxypeptidase family protein
MDALRDLLGADRVSTSELIMGAEDFSYMAQAAPGCFLRLGVHNPAWPEHYPVHRADFRLDEDALPIGTAALVATAVRWMEEKR